jgi:transporter family protein
VVAVDKLSVVLTLVLAIVFLHEEFTMKSSLGAALITAGTWMMIK